MIKLSVRRDQYTWATKETLQNEPSPGFKNYQYCKLETEPGFISKTVVSSG